MNGAGGARWKSLRADSASACSLRLCVVDVLRLAQLVDVDGYRLLVAAKAAKTTPVASPAAPVARSTNDTFRWVVVRSGASMRLGSARCSSTSVENESRPVLVMATKRRPAGTSSGLGQRGDPHEPAVHEDLCPILGAQIDARRALAHRQVDCHRIAEHRFHLALQVVVPGRAGADDVLAWRQLGAGG